MKVVFVSLYLYVPEEGSLLPKYRDCTTSNDFELYLMCCVVMLLLLIIYMYVCIHVCVFVCILLSIISSTARKNTQYEFLYIC